jgi:hypothetical protein
VAPLGLTHFARFPGWTSGGSAAEPAVGWKHRHGYAEQARTESLSWLPSGEQDRIWREEIRPRLASLTVRDWSGCYEATEWRTGQHECVIEFMHCYAPI